jgi:hypothetical protein
VCPEVGSDVPKGIAGGQLAKKQLNELIPTIEITGSVVAIVPFYALPELIPIHIVLYLGKNVFSRIHSGLVLDY